MSRVITHIAFAFRHPVARRGGIAAVVAMCILVMVISFAWYPSASRHNEIQHDISQLRNQLITSKKLNELRHTYNNTETTLVNIEKKLATSTSLAEFARTLNRLASQYKIKIISSSNRDSQLTQNYKIQYQELMLQGKYTAIRQFIFDLRDIPVWTLIKEIRLKKKKGSDELIADFVLTSYQKQANI